MTQKEDVIANAFLSSETVELLKSYVLHPSQREKDRQTRAERQGRKIRENQYLFPSNGSRPITEERVNGLLKILAEKAQIHTTGKSLTFHCFRKMFLSASIDSGIGLTAGKKPVGKAIPQGDDTYLTTVQLKDKFIQLKKFLTIEQTPEPEGKKEIGEFKNLVTELQKDLAQQKTIVETVTEKNIEIAKDLEGMKKELAEFRTFYEIIRDVVPENLLIQLQLAKSTSDDAVVTNDWRELVERARTALDEIEQKGISEEKKVKGSVKVREGNKKQ
jgi:hypothetical protein